MYLRAACVTSETARQGRRADAKQASQRQISAASVGGQSPKRRIVGAGSWVGRRRTRGCDAAQNPWLAPWQLILRNSNAVDRESETVVSIPVDLGPKSLDALSYSGSSSVQGKAPIEPLTLRGPLR